MSFSRRGRFAFLRARDVPVVDTFQIFGPNFIPALVSFDVRWEAIEPPMQLGQGSAVSPTDPAAFLGSFAAARAVGTFSGSELGFSFVSNPGVSSDLGYAELGTERNGAFL